MSRISNSDWQDLLEALTGKKDFTVEEEKNRVLLLKTKNLAFFEQLQQIFSSPKNITDKLKFVIKRSGRSSPSEEKKFESDSTVSLIDGYNIFARLLEYGDPKLKKSLIFDWDLTGVDCLVEDLSATPDLVPIRKTAINVLCSILRKLNYGQLHAVLSAGVFKASIVDKESKTEGPIAFIIEKILFFDEQKQVVIFDYKLFISCLTSPQAHLEENSSAGEHQIRFPSAIQLLNYLRTSVGTEFIIKANGDGEEKTGHMILLGDVSTPTAAISQPIHFHYALDCSRSMNWQNDPGRTLDETLFPQILKISKEIAEKIGEVATSSTQFSIYPIKGPQAPVTCEDFKIKETKALERCKGFLDSMEADSGTNLYGVFLRIFELIGQSPGVNHIVVGVTDGEDQNENLERKALFRRLTEICRAYQTSTTPPQVFIVTIGRNVAVKLIKKLSSAMQATIIEVEKHEQVAQLFDYIRQMHLPMKVVDVLIKMQEEVKAQARISVFDGHPRSLKNMVVTEGQTVEFGGAAYIISRKSSHKPHKTISDKPDNLWAKGSHSRPAPTGKQGKGPDIVTEYPEPTRRHSYP